MDSLTLSRALSYIIDLSFSSSLALLLLSFSIIGLEHFAFAVVAFSFLIWTFSEYYNDGRTLGREIILNLEVLVSLLVSALTAFLVSFFSSVFMVPIFVLSLLICFMVAGLYDLETIVIKDRIALRNRTAKHIILRNLYKAVLILFYPVLFIDFLLVYFKGKRIIDFALPNEVNMCKK